MLQVIELNFEFANIKLNKDRCRISTKTGTYDITKNEFDGVVITIDDTNKLVIHRPDTYIKLKILTNSPNCIETQFDEDYKEILINDEHRICLSMLSESLIKIDFHVKTNKTNDFVWIASVNCQI